MSLSRLGPYRILGLLGRGGVAEVHLAVAVGASGFEKKIALKTLRPELRGDPALERSLIEEAKLGARLAHRNLVQVHELGVDEGVYYARMDLVDGGALADWLKRGPPPLPIALFIAEEVLAALTYLHAARGDDGRPLGLTHRDVSPANVLVSKSGEVKLADLGIAKATLLRDRTQANVRKGTYAYMSPEQVSGAPLGPTSDLFAFGVLLHELVSGERPFEGVTPHETMRQIVDQAPRMASSLPEPLRVLVASCLQKDPAARIGERELRRELGAARRSLVVEEAGAAELAAWSQVATTRD
jgi:serine/threonine-protein kinase